jgi:hypothetical protein
MQRRYFYRESRGARRVTFIGEVECSEKGSGSLVTRINDLSVTGAFIDSVMSFPVGTRLGLKFRVGENVIETQAEVRYSLRQAGMGVRFLDLTDEHREVIECLVEGRPLPVTGPLEMPANMEEDHIVLSGSFAAFSFFDVIHIISSNHLSGALGIDLASSRGEIYFREGEIVGAQSGDAQGIDALHRFLAPVEGSFEFKQSSRKYDRTIKAANTTSLLLDLISDKEPALY